MCLSLPSSPRSSVRLWPSSVQSFICTRVPGDSNWPIEGIQWRSVLRVDPGHQGDISNDSNCLHYMLALCPTISPHRKAHKVSREGPWAVRKTSLSSCTNAHAWFTQRSAPNSRSIACKFVHRIFKGLPCARHRPRGWDFTNDSDTLCACKEPGREPRGGTPTPEPREEPRRSCFFIQFSDAPLRDF